MIINISKETLNKNKFSIIIFILLCFSVYFFVIPKVVEYVRIKLIEYNLNKIIDEQGFEILNIEKEALLNEENNLIKNLQDEYSQKRSTTENNYNQIINAYKEELIKKKTDAIRYGEDDEYIWYIETANIQTELLKKIKWVLSLHQDVVDNKIQEIEIKKTLSINAWYDKLEKLNSKTDLEGKNDWKYNTKKYEFSLSQVKKVDNIIVYDRNKLWIPIDLWITLPSLFSYKNNGIAVSDMYYDLHKGTDLKTMPYKNIVISFPWNKTWKVIYANEDWFGKRLIIENKEENERYEYSHLQDIGVKVDDEIIWNQKIATTWNTWPYSKWYHLHYSVYKDGMLSSYDWWADMDHVDLVKKIYPHKDIDFIIPYLQKTPANIPQAMWIYLQFVEEKKNKESFDKIMVIISENEKNRQFWFQEIMRDPFIKNNIKKDEHDAFKRMINFVDKMDEIRKSELIKYIRNNSTNNITLFNQEKIAQKKTSLKDSIINSNAWLKKFNLAFLNSTFVQEKKELLKIGECSKKKNLIFESYIPSQSISDWHLLNNENIRNINKLFPIIYNSAKEINIASRINEKFKLKWDFTIDNCDIAFMEVWKWYQEHTLYLDNPSSAWIFQNLSINYYKLFPKEKWKPVLSDKQYIQQSKDAMEHSFWKLSYIKGNTFRKREVNKDFLLKYWVWSYHGLIGDDPEKDYYVSNNLIYNGLKIIDTAAAPGRLGVKDGAFTFALKLYKLSQ